jgi:hypothetical protein
MAEEHRAEVVFFSTRLLLHLALPCVFGLADSFISIGFAEEGGCCWSTATTRRHC